jgi:alkanesulfonate monooxygenase SsuD/methylene tetrahydromethanopterin reductase-like flavin-dependent oxidoreductase (luciferase family)
MLLSYWPNMGQGWPSLAEGVAHAEATGWHGVYLTDHFMGDGGGFGQVTAPTLECTAGLAALAGATSRVRLSSLVMSATYRHPAVLANWAATVDHASGGRLTLGLGAGWQTNEHEQYGIRLGTPGERRRRLDEYLTVVRSLLDRPRTSFDGRFFTLDDAVCEPKPLQERLPILVGAKGDRMMEVVARHADVWNMWSLPSAMAERSAALDRACEAIGRDPSTIARSTQALVFLTDDEARAEQLVEAVAPRAAIAGPPAAFADVVAEWDEIGVSEVIVPDFTLGSGSARADAMDALREAVEGR